MSEFVIRRFLWVQQGKASAPSPFPKDFRPLCSDFDLAAVEHAAAYYELPELPQAIFYAMLLNETEKLGVAWANASVAGGGPYSAALGSIRVVDLVAQ